MLRLLPIALQSAWHRRYTLGLMLFSIALSVMLLLAIERIRNDARETFGQAVSGTDLIVGARTSPVQLVLYSVFRIGEATSNIDWKSYQKIGSHPLVAWSVPISLGDSHRGFAVVGTSTAYFDHFRYGAASPLEFAQGGRFSGLFEAVLGAEVAHKLGYKIGERIVLNHGAGEMTGTAHADKPFVVTGILARTGTPVDRSIHVTLESIEAIHLDWQGGAPMPGVSIPPEFVQKFDLTPKTVTAALVGLHSRAAAFRMQRYVNEFRDEPLLAVLPGVALSQLWETVGVFEQALLLVSALVVLVSVSGLGAVVLAGLNERRRELALLRSVGAQPRHILMLLVFEGAAVTLAAVILGTALLALLGTVFAPLVEARYGIHMRGVWISVEELYLVGAVIVAGLLASVVPAWRAYRLSLSDGLMPRL